MSWKGNLMSHGQWYYCLNHQQVEPYEACRSASRLGPYATMDEARDALVKVHERNDQWETDPRFHDESDDPDEDAELKKEHDLGGWGPFRI